MMPDLGKYADAVLSSYAASALLLGVLVIVSVRRSRKVRAEMEHIENRMRRNG